MLRPCTIDQLARVCHAHRTGVRSRPPGFECRRNPPRRGRSAARVSRGIGRGWGRSGSAPSIRITPDRPRRRLPVPRTAESARGGRATGPGRASAFAKPTRSAIVAGMSRRLTNRLTTRPEGSAGRDGDQERHADLGPVEALAVIEQVVLAETLAMIGRDDHDGPVEHAATLQLAEELTQSVVDRGDATIVGVHRHGPRRPGQLRPVRHAASPW